MRTYLLIIAQTRGAAVRTSGGHSGSPQLCHTFDIIKTRMMVTAIFGVESNN